MSSLTFQILKKRLKGESMKLFNDLKEKYERHQEERFEKKAKSLESLNSNVAKLEYRAGIVRKEQKAKDRLKTAQDTIRKSSVLYKVGSAIRNTAVKVADGQKKKLSSSSHNSKVKKVEVKPFKFSSPLIDDNEKSEDILKW